MIDAFSSREPVSTSLENATQQRPDHIPANDPAVEGLRCKPGPFLFWGARYSVPTIVMAGLVPAIHVEQHSQMSKGGYVYILASAPNGVLYVGVTSDLVRRVYEHREGLVAGFTKRHNVKRLVYFEQYDDIQTAIQREHNMKHWSRDWKVGLILGSNPSWADLFDTIV